MKVKTFCVANSYIINQCYLIYNNEEGILIDPAWDFSLIDDFLIDNKITLSGILLTHSHIDHTNLCQKFSQKYNVPVCMSMVEILDYGFKCVNLKAINHLETIYLASFRVISILTPGHTSGSMCYIVDNHLFSGDTVFIEGVGICVDKKSSASELFDSVQFIKETLRSDTIFWPGHSFGQSPGKNLSYLLKNNIYFQLDNRDHFVKFRMRNNNVNRFKFFNL